MLRNIHTIKLKHVSVFKHYTLVASEIQLWSTRLIHQGVLSSLKLERSGSSTTITLFTSTASCWLVTDTLLIPGMSIVNPPCYTEGAIRNLRTPNWMIFLFHSCFLLQCNKIAISTEMFLLYLAYLKAHKHGTQITTFARPWISTSKMLIEITY